MLRTGIRYITAVSVLGLTWLVPPAVAAQRDRLFSPAGRAAAQLDSTAPASTRHDAATLRRRLVTMDLERLRRARAAVSALSRPPAHLEAASRRTGKRDAVPATDEILTLNLFDDVVLTGIVEQTAPTFSGGYSISGRVAGEALGTLTIVVNGERVAGSVRTLDGTYRIRSVGAGRYAVSEVQEPPLDCQVLRPEAE